MKRIPWRTVVFALGVAAAITVAVLAGAAIRAVFGSPENHVIPVTRPISVPSVQPQVATWVPPHTREPIAHRP